MGKTDKVRIRWMINRDLPEVLAIERQSFGVAWADGDFARCLRGRSCISMVAEHEGQDQDDVVGFMVYDLDKKRIHLLRLAVAADFRRRGVGSQMVAKLVAKLSWQRRCRLMVDISEYNTGAQLFLASRGFRAREVLRDFFDNGASAYVFDIRYDVGAAVIESIMAGTARPMTSSEREKIKSKGA